GDLVMNENYRIAFDGCMRNSIEHAVSAGNFKTLRMLAFDNQAGADVIKRDDRLAVIDFQRFERRTGCHTLFSVDEFFSDESQSPPHFLFVFGLNVFWVADVVGDRQTESGRVVCYM